jgi:hypothetical protein
MALSFPWKDIDSTPETLFRMFFFYYSRSFMVERFKQEKNQSIIWIIIHGEIKIAMVGILRKEGRAKK